MSEEKVTWEELDENKEFAKLNDGSVVLVATKGQRENVVPIFCPLCSYPMRTQDDAEAYLKSKTCSPCHKEWAEVSPIDFDSSKWKDYLVKREIIAKPIINIV